MWLLVILIHSESFDNFRRPPRVSLGDFKGNAFPLAHFTRWQIYSPGERLLLKLTRRTVSASFPVTREISCTSLSFHFDASFWKIDRYNFEDRRTIEEMINNFLRFLVLARAQSKKPEKSKNLSTSVNYSLLRLIAVFRTTCCLNSNLVR